MANARAPAPRRKLGSGGGTVTPLYHQLYMALRQQIREGRLDPAKPLPGEHQLARQYKVSRVTVRRTLEALELEGLVARRRGVGTFPVARPQEFRDRYNIGGLKEPATPAEGRTESATLSVATVDAPAGVAEIFGGEQPTLTRVIRRRSAGAEPFTLMTAYLPGEIAAELGRRTLEAEGLPGALEKAGYELARAEQTITATAADDGTASLLRVPVGAPLISMRTVFSDRDDRPIVVMHALFRPDRYEYRTTVLRRGGDRGQRWREPY